jgi:hypothetical protein
MPITYDTGSANTEAANTTTPTTGTITTAEANELLLLFYFGADNIAASNFTAATSPNVSSGISSGSLYHPAPNAWVEVADAATSIGAGTDNAYAHAVKTTAGATGTLQCTSAVSSRHGMIVGAFKLPVSNAPYTLTASKGTFNLTGKVINVLVSHKATISTCTFNLTGSATSFVVTYPVIVSTGAFALTGNIATLVAVTHYARPVTDVSVGAWTPSAGTDLYAMVDEDTYVDTDYIQTTAASTCELGLSAAIDPGTSSGQVLKYRAKSDTTGTLIATLMQGATTIATRTHTSVPSSWTDYTMTLTSGECDAITNYAGLKVRLEAV